jgi:hypothetical protein
VEGTRKPLTIPRIPTPVDFYTAQQMGTRTTSGAGRGRQSASNIPDVESNEVIGVQHLTFEQATMFNIALTAHKMQFEEFKREETQIKNVWDFLKKTINAKYASTTINTTRDLAEVYEKLKKQAGRDENDIRSDLKHDYDIHTRPWSRIPKDIGTWITDWEHLMEKGNNRKMGFAMDVREWSDRFLDCVKLYDTNWENIYRITHKEEIKAGTLTYRDLSGAFREEVANKQRRNPKSFGKGSFPTFAGEDAAEDENDSEKQDDKKRQKKRQKKRRPVHGSVSETGKPRCRACDSESHTLEYCFYVFPKKAPQGWRLSPLTQKTVDQNLRDDSKLAEEVARLRISEKRNAEKNQKDRDNDGSNRNE